MKQLFLLSTLFYNAIPTGAFSTFRLQKRVPSSTSRVGVVYNRKQISMKRAPPSPRNEVIPSSTEGEIPPNLTRKVRAKRPVMGHVVPKDVRLRRQKKGGSSNPRLRSQGKAIERSSSQNNPSNLKILGGSVRGRRLDSPDVYLRPMMGKVREAVFSTFTSFGLYDKFVVKDSSAVPISNTRHLDIFAGSGSVGIESLSRGAKHCTFVDLANNCCDAIHTNLNKCDFEQQGEVKCCDAVTALTQPESVGIEGTFQIVTICPPYEEVVYADILHAVANSKLVEEDTIVMVEYPVELGCLPHVLQRDNGGKLIGVRNRRYGRTVIAMYIVNPTGRLEVANSRPEEFIAVR